MALSKLSLSDKTSRGGAVTQRQSFNTTERLLYHCTQFVGTHLLDSPSQGISRVNDVATVELELFSVQGVWARGGRSKVRGVLNVNTGALKLELDLRK